MEAPTAEIEESVAAPTAEVEAVETPVAKTVTEVAETVAAIEDVTTDPPTEEMPEAKKTPKDSDTASTEEV